MTKHHFQGSALVSFLGITLISCLALCDFAAGQELYPGQEVRVHDLPSVTARTTHASDVLAASLEIIFHDKDVCCGKNSALDDSLQATDPKSLKDIAAKLQGRHLLGDGHPIMVTVEYLTPEQVNARHLITMLTDNHAALMIWDSHLYIVEGLTYVETADRSVGDVEYFTHKFLLQDARFSDSRREVTFDRLTDDASKVQGLLFLQSKLE